MYFGPNDTGTLLTFNNNANYIERQDRSGNRKQRRKEAAISRKRSKD